MDQNTSITERDAEAVLSGICIPPCPAILTRLMKEMRADDPDFGRISQLISEDASLAAAMLRTVNSAFYGLRTKATSVQQAIHLLGLRHISQLVTGVLLRDAFSNGNSERMDDYWEYSSTIVQISAYLAGRFDGFNRDQAYTFALFRDCGMLAMMDSYQDYKPALPGDSASEGDAIARENMLHQMNHALVGANLAKIWLLPEGLYQSILWHHDYVNLLQGREIITKDHARQIALALVAEWIYVKQTVGTESADWRKSCVFVMEDLGTSMEELDAVMVQTMQDSGIF